MKYLYNENAKTLKKEIKEDIKRWLDLACAFCHQAQLIQVHEGNGPAMPKNYFPTMFPNL